MKCKFLLSTVSFISTVFIYVGFCFALQANASGNGFQYTLGIEHGVDLSVLYRGPLQLQNFSDQRANLSGKQISDSIAINKPVTELVRDAVAQAFAQGGTKLVTENPQQIFTGEITELQAETLTENGEEQVQVTVRAKLMLQSPGGNTHWQSSVLGRASVPHNEGVNVALQKALDKFIDNLFYDDYLIMQLVE